MCSFIKLGSKKKGHKPTLALVVRMFSLVAFVVFYTLARFQQLHIDHLHMRSEPYISILRIDLGEIVCRFDEFRCVPPFIQSRSLNGSCSGRL